MLRWELKCPALAQSHFLPCSWINSPANTAWTPTFPPLAPLLSSQPSLHFLSYWDWLTHAVHEAVCDSTPNIPSNALPMCSAALRTNSPSHHREGNGIHHSDWDSPRWVRIRGHLLGHDTCQAMLKSPAGLSLQLDSGKPLEVVA